MLTSAQIHRAYTRPEPVWHFMPKGGWQYTNFSGSSFSSSPASGFVAGMALKIPVRYSWWLQPEVLFSRRSAGLRYPATGSQPAYEVQYTFNFLEIPLLLSYRPNDIVELQAGPQLAMFLSSAAEATEGQASPGLPLSELNRWDVAVAAGVELNVSPLAFGVRYAYGFTQVASTDLANSYLGNAKLQGLQLYGALVF